MHVCRTMLIALLAAGLAAGCAPSAPTEGAAAPGCGNGACEASEDALACPQDCDPAALSGKSLTTRLLSDGVGEIAVLVAYPQATRFPDGAGVVVIVPPFFSGGGGFATQPDFTSIGLVQISFLWPGEGDERFAVSSEGEFDYGGEACLQALRDVLLFASGRMLDLNGRSLSTLIPVTPMVEEVGMYAFDHAGLAAVSVLAAYGERLDGVEYFVGHENPTVASLAALEIGHYSESGTALPNPFYTYPGAFDFYGLNISYGSLRWDADFSDPVGGFTGRPYFDLNGDGSLSGGDHLLGPQVPQMFGKRFYSTALTRALLDNRALAPETWPADLATPEEAAEAWGRLESPPRYIDLLLNAPNLKVMLLFARSDHAQVALDKPHIHQAFQGFRFAAQLRWVRLNPDRIYLGTLSGTDGGDFPDNPANTQPVDWLEIGSWAYPGGGETGGLAPLAALAEMADRAHTARWDENLGDMLFGVLPKTPGP